MKYDHNKKFGLLKFHSGYGKFNLNSPKGYTLKKKLTRRLTETSLKVTYRSNHFAHAQTQCHGLAFAQRDA